MKRFIKYIALALTTVLLCRCANIVTPSGGPKDVTPPVVLSASPENNSTGFKGKTIQINFDEFITLDNPSKNILISPPLKKKPSYRSSGKNLIIKLEEPLKPETTYSISFGDAIKDLHEGNVMKGFSYVFSTGESIDTLSLKGKAISASTLKPSEGFYIGLYTTETDTLTFDFVTITDKEGNFEFSGLSDNDYHIFALKDDNSNLRYDLPNEEIGFLTDVVKPYHIDKKIVIDTTSDTIPTPVLKDDTPNYEIFTFVQEDSIQKIFKKELVEEGLLRFVFRYPAEKVEIKPLETLPDTFDIMPVYSARKDSVLWYFTPNKDSLLVSIKYDTIINDTTHFSLKPRESVSNRRKKDKEDKKVTYLSLTNNLKNGKLKPEQQFILKFSEPITRINIHDTTLFIIDKDTIFNDLHFTKADEYGFRFILDKELENDKKYQMLIPDSTFFSFRGHTNKATKLSFEMQDESQLGNIYLTVEVPEGVPQLIIELTDDKDRVLDKHIINSTQEIAFEYLEPTKYKLKATLDLDANGVWSPGNFKKKIQPEKIVYYNNILEVRANWDIDLDEPWKIEK